MTWVCTAHKGFLTILVRKVTTHHPHDWRLRLEPLLLVDIMIGLDHWRMTMMTWVGPAPPAKILMGIVPGQLGTHSEDVHLSIDAVVAAAVVVVAAVDVVAAVVVAAVVVVAVAFDVGAAVVVDAVVVVVAVALDVGAAVVAAVVGNQLGGLVPSFALFIIGGT